MLWTLRQPFYRVAKLIVKYIRHPVEAGTSKPWELSMSIYEHAFQVSKFEICSVNSWSYKKQI